MLLTAYECVVVHRPLWIRSYDRPAVSWMVALLLWVVVCFSNLPYFLGASGEP